MGISFGYLIWAPHMARNVHMLKHAVEHNSRVTGVHTQARQQEEITCLWQMRSKIFSGRLPCLFWQCR